MYLEKTKVLYLIVLFLLCATGVLQAQLADNLVAYYKMNEESGLTVTDETGAHPGTLTKPLDWVPGYEGNALQFIGGSGGPFVNLGAWQTNGPEGLGLAVWLKWNGTNSVYQGIMSQRDGTMYWWIELAPAGNELRFKSNTSPQSNLLLTGTHLTQGEWTHVAFSHDAVAGTGVIYLNGEERLSGNWALPSGDFSNLRAGLGVVNVADGLGTFNGAMDEAMIFDAPFSAEDLKAIMQGLGNKNIAAMPVPSDGNDDVIRDSILSWTPGQYAATHQVYLGESFEDVNSAGVPTASVDVNAFDPGRLEFGKTYYWRVDEVNGTPDKTVFRGNVWSFTAEPYSILIPGSAMVVTASSASGASLSEKTIDGSGLDGNTHSTNQEDMWLSASPDLTPWLMVEFDRIQELDQMWVWNSNSTSEAFIGWGIKEVNIEYSTDGVDWTPLSGSTQVSRASGLPTYNAPQVIDFGLVQAKCVRLNILTNWGGLLKQYGVAEVQFYALPVLAREPKPASGSVDVLPDSIVTWRTGRQAGQHTVYVSTDSTAVAQGTADSVTSMTNTLDLGSLDLHLGETYYWRVDEVNEAEAMSVWAGPVWSLSTPEALVVDDFESYGNLSPDRPFQTWLDGYGYSADEFFPVKYAGNGTGAGIGHDIWSPDSPYFDGDIMETDIVLSGSYQSMPFYYSNTGGVASLTERVFAVPQDWTIGGVKTLSIAFYGQPENTGTLYVKINNTKIPYDGDPSNLTRLRWTAWHIDLSSLAVSSVNTLTIGVDGTGATGMVLLDNILLYQSAPELAVPVAPTTASLVAHWALDEVSGTIATDSAGSNHGTVEGAASWVAGHDGGALALDGGLTSYVNCGASAVFNITEAVTLSAWVKASEPASAFKPIIGKGDHAYMLRHGNGQTFDFFIHSNGGWHQISTPAPDALYLDSWNHVVGTFDGSQIRLYVNGVLGTTQDYTGTISVATHDVNIGRNSEVIDRVYQGVIDDVRIYKSALTEAEILYLSNE